MIDYDLFLKKTGLLDVIFPWVGRWVLRLAVQPVLYQSKKARCGTVVYGRSITTHYNSQDMGLGAINSH